MPQNNPTVSLGLMAYNRAYCLPVLLDCLLAQTFGDFELIISDDASSDNTRQICEEYAKKDGRIRYVKQEKNLNAPACFKAVLSCAQGTYFAWIQDDDLYDKRFLEDCLGVFENNPRLVMVFTDMVDIDKNGREIGHPDPATYLPQSNDTYERLKQFTLSYFSDGRNQLICGLWKRESILDDPLFGPNAKDDRFPYYWGFENYFVFRNLAKGPIGFVPQTRFFRRSRARETYRPTRPMIPRIAVTAYHRFRHAFGSPYFWYIARRTAGIEELSHWQRFKLLWWNLFAMGRVLVVKKI